MSTDTLQRKIEELKELEQFQQELADEANAIKDDIKQELVDRGVEELHVGPYMVHYSEVLTTKFDSKRLKETMLDVWKAFTKQVPTHRFQIT